MSKAKVKTTKRQFQEQISGTNKKRMLRYVHFLTFPKSTTSHNLPTCYTLISKNN